VGPGDLQSRRDRLADPRIGDQLGERPGGGAAGQLHAAARQQLPEPGHLVPHGLLGGADTAARLALAAAHPDRHQAEPEPRRHAGDRLVARLGELGAALGHRVVGELLREHPAADAAARLEHHRLDPPLRQ
jgi:hypothetical protein